MNKLQKAVVALCATFIFSGSASALTITDLYGDKDGFGIGLVDGYTQSTWPAPPIVADDAADIGTITDQYLLSNQTWSHTYDVSGLSSITSASLEIQTYAQGYLGLASLYIDGVFVGNLTDGDTTYEGTGPNTNSVRLDTFDLYAYAGSLLDGASLIRIDTVRGDDWWYLDYSELTISGTAASVPEPATLPLIGFALVCLGLARRRRNA